MLLNRSRGELGGKPFAQHCSCPAVLRCSVGLTMAAFLGTIFVWEKYCFSRPGTASACAPSARGQRPCCPHLPHKHFSLKYECATFRSFATGALVAPPCAPDAPSAQQKSYSSRSRLAKSYGRFAPLSLKQDCFFRVSSSKIKISLPSPPAADNLMIFHPEASSSRLRSDSFQKFAPASQTLVFEKQSSLRVY